MICIINKDCVGRVLNHHIMLKSRYRGATKEVRDAEENLVPLCVKHHAEVHGKCGMQSFFVKYKIWEVYDRALTKYLEWNNSRSERLKKRW